MQRASDETDDLITIAEAARRVGVNKSTLSRQVRDGLIRSYDGKVRLAEVLEDRAANIDTSRRPGARNDATMVDGQPMPFHVAKAMKEGYLAQLRKLEFEEKSGTLVNRAAAEKLFFDTAREMRDAWIAWPGRVAIELAEDIGVDQQTGKVDPRSLTIALSAFVRQHLSEMGEPEADIP